MKKKWGENTRRDGENLLVLCKREKELFLSICARVFALVRQSIAHTVAFSLLLTRAFSLTLSEHTYPVKLIRWLSWHSLFPVFFFLCHSLLLFFSHLVRWQAIDRETPLQTRTSHTYTRARTLKSDNKCKSEWMARITRQRTTRIYFIVIVSIVYYYYFMFFSFICLSGRCWGIWAWAWSIGVE